MLDDNAAFVCYTLMGINDPLDAYLIWDPSSRPLSYTRHLKAESVLGEANISLRAMLERHPLRRAARGQAVQYFSKLLLEIPQALYAKDDLIRRGEGVAALVYDLSLLWLEDLGRYLNPEELEPRIVVRPSHELQPNSVRLSFGTGVSVHREAAGLAAELIVNGSSVPFFADQRLALIGDARILPDGLTHWPFASSCFLYVGRSGDEQWQVYSGGTPALDVQRIAPAHFEISDVETELVVRIEDVSGVQAYAQSNAQANASRHSTTESRQQPSQTANASPGFVDDNLAEFTFDSDLFSDLGSFDEFEQVEPEVDCLASVDRHDIDRAADGLQLFGVLEPYDLNHTIAETEQSTLGPSFPEPLRRQWRGVKTVQGGDNRIYFTIGDTIIGRGGPLALPQSVGQAGAAPKGLSRRHALVHRSETGTSLVPSGRLPVWRKPVDGKRFKMAKNGDALRVNRGDQLVVGPLLLEAL